MKSWAKTRTSRPSTGPCPVTTASPRALLLHAKIDRPVAHERVQLPGVARVEQLLDPLAGGELQPASVLLLGLGRGSAVAGIAQLGQLAKLLVEGLGVAWRWVIGSGWNSGSPDPACAARPPGSHALPGRRRDALGARRRRSAAPAPRRGTERGSMRAGRRNGPRGRASPRGPGESSRRRPSGRSGWRRSSGRSSPACAATSGGRCGAVSTCGARGRPAKDARSAGHGHWSSVGASSSSIHGRKAASTAWPSWSWAVVTVGPRAVSCDVVGGDLVGCAGARERKPRGAGSATRGAVDGSRRCRGWGNSACRPARWSRKSSSAGEHAGR